jgi:hypothetical protein
MLDYPIELTRIDLVDGEPHYVIGQTVADSFADLNFRRAWEGKPPVAPASSLTLTAHEARRMHAVRIMEWRRRYGLRVVGGRR